MTAQHAVLFDTSVATANTGDEIIMDSVRQELRKCVGGDFLVRLPTQDYIGSVGRQWVRDAKVCIVGGTNLLSSQYRKYRQWKITPFDALSLRGKVVLMGVGWWQYQRPPDLLTRSLYRTILSSESDVFHSVRDEYTLNMLKSIGINNVLNTCCPTMWGLDAGHCGKIPARRSDSVVMTLTDYSKNVELDRALLKELSARYSEVIAWPQGIGDKNYMIEIGIKNIIESGLSSLDHVLNRPDIDYVGTRLHAGIRALQHGRRALILAVDNRATEISKDTGLWVVDRLDIEAIVYALDAEKATQLRLPSAAIQQWKDGLADVVFRKAFRNQ